MDITLLRTLVTVMSFLVFVGIVLWALSGKNRARFDEAAMLPFADDELAAASGDVAINMLPGASLPIPPAPPKEK